MDAFACLLFLPAALYIALQILVPFRVPPEKRGLALLPLPFMAVLLGFTAYWLAIGSNLWPLMLIFASPVACLVLVLVLWLNPKTA